MNLAGACRVMRSEPVIGLAVIESGWSLSVTRDCRRGDTETFQLASFRNCKIQNKERGPISYEI